MKTKDLYLEKYAYFDKLLSESPFEKPDMVVVIPCHNEPDLLSTLSSLIKCQRPTSIIEVLIVVNHAINANEKIKRTNLETVKTIKGFVDDLKPWISIHCIYAKDLPPRHAGVGLARKIGMDEAVRRLKDDGIIICLDADCTVDTNYFIAIEQYFLNHPNSNGCSIYFEHPLEGLYPKEIYRSIIEYELHLRYFVDMQRRMGLPYAFHTVGSSMSVRNSNYQQVGGMNKRKAGEDFYFIQKLIKQGGYGNCNATTVRPSPRVSDRVPFGTGKAIGDMLQSKNSNYMTYNPRSFKVIHSFVENLKNAWLDGTIDAPPELSLLYTKKEMGSIFQEVISNTSSKETYLKRIFQWFDAFRLMKTLHYLRDHYFPSLIVGEAVEKAGFVDKGLNTLEMLRFYRHLDKDSSN